MKNQRLLSVSGVTLTLATFALVACGGGGGSISNDSPTPPPVAAPVASLAPAGTPRITLNGANRNQTIDGWFVYSRYGEDDKANNRLDNSFEPYAAPVMQHLANQVGTGITEYLPIRKRKTSDIKRSTTTTMRIR